MTKIDVTDRLTPGAKALVKMRTADMIHAAQMGRGITYRDVSAFFAGALEGHRVAENLKWDAWAARRNARCPGVLWNGLLCTLRRDHEGHHYLSNRPIRDAWSGNPDTDRAWAHDIGFTR